MCFFYEAYLLNVYDIEIGLFIEVNFHKSKRKKSFNNMRGLEKRLKILKVRSRK